ncbi:1-phosphofructokinase [Bacillus sp. HMF5848]|uniref:1-phosphofructokinase n=1 Tax=Bacillus sp. HMF5848 TaxID=2495421 RepID=UPI001C8C5200|nr:1-phosphofructokinase [Bacillus sp. HMF5848]
MKSVLTITLNPAIDKTVIVDRFVVGGLNRIEPIPQLDPGGKGVNVAKVLKNFDVPVIATGFVAGKQGEHLLSSLEKRGIATSFIKVDGETRTNLKIVDKANKQTTEVNEAGFQVSVCDLDSLFNHLSRLYDHTSHVVLGGSIPLGAPKDIYQQLIEHAKNHQVKIILDADGEAFRLGVKAGPFAIKPNLYELEQFVDQKLPTYEDIEKAARNLICDYNIQLVVVSLGKEGALFITNESSVFADALSIKAKSSVGAGDSMVAMIIYSLVKNLALEELAIWSVTAGSVTASKSGTEVCSLEEVAASLDKINVKHL